MRTSSLFITLLTSTVIAACGDDAPSSPDAAPVLPDTPNTPANVTISTSVAPVLVAYREAAGPWQTLAVNGASYALTVQGPYLVTVVCDDGADGIFTWRIARTLDDDRALDLPCGTFPVVNVTGHMVQAGRIGIGFGISLSSTPEWDFDVSVEPGTRELFASTTDAIAVRRGITIAGDTNLTPAVDVIQEGKPLVASPLVVTNAVGSELVSANVSVLSEASTFVRIFRGDPAQAKVAPDAVLVAGDRQRATITATDGVHARSARRGNFRVGGAASFSLPEPLGEVTSAIGAGGLVMTWSTLPANDLVFGSLDAFAEDGSQSWFEELEISPAFIAATSATEARFDNDIPGFRPEWQIDLTKEYSRSLTVSKTLPDGSQSSSYSETLNTPPPPPELARVRAATQRFATAHERKLARRR
jgi:hypothetical protein